MISIAPTQQIRKWRPEGICPTCRLLRSEVPEPNQAVRQQSPGVEGGRASPLRGSERACSACVCTLYGDSIPPQPRGSLRNSTDPSRSSGRHPQPTASQSHPQGLPLLGPGPPHWLSYPHVPYGRLKLVVLAVASQFLTQAPCPLTDPSAAAQAPQPDGHAGVLWRSQ